MCHTGGVRVWLPAGLAVAAASALLMPVNRTIAADFCYGDACTLQDRMADAAPQMYTSGIVVGHLCAYLVGALVVAREREPRWPKAAAAGFALGVVQAAVAIPYAATRLHVDAGPTMLGSPGVWRAIVVSLLAYPLWALLGLGVGPILRGRARLVLATLAAPVLLAWIGLCFGAREPFAIFLMPLLAVYFLADDRVGFYAAVILLCALAVLATVANLVGATARRSAVTRRTGT